MTEDRLKRGGYTGVYTVGKQSGGAEKSWWKQSQGAKLQQQAW